MPQSSERTPVPTSRRRPGRAGRALARPALLPVVVFAVWRCLHALVVRAFGGSQEDATYAFDAQFYLDILRSGYDVPPGGWGEFSEVAFFPGLAWVTDVVQLVVRDEGVATAVTANALALAAFVTVWGAVRAWTDDDAVARRAVVALALVPTSYYLWMYYTEALLVAATAGAAWCSRRERHAGAYALLALAATARVVGVLAGPALAVARVIRLRRVDLVAVLHVLASAVGFAAVLARQAVEIGDPWGWTKAQEAWGRELAPPWRPLVTAVGEIVDTLPSLAEGLVLDIVAVVGVGALVAVLALRGRRGRWPLEPALVAAAFWAAPLCSRLLAGQVRFVLAAWPVLLVPAAGWPALPRAVRALLVLVACALTVLLLRRLAVGAFTA